jgi:hypothetical protein
VEIIDPPRFDTYDRPHFPTHEGVYLERITSFTTPHDEFDVLAFYEDALLNGRWQRSRPAAVFGEHYYSWVVDVKAWEAPPCNATPVLGIPVFLVRLSIHEVSADVTQVVVVEGISPGYPLSGPVPTLGTMGYFLPLRRSGDADPPP